MIASKILIKNIYETQIKQNFIYKIFKFSTNYYFSKKTIHHINKYNNLKNNLLLYKSSPNFKINKFNLSNNYSSSIPLMKFHYSSYQKKSNINYINSKKYKKRKKIDYYMNLFAFSGVSGFMAYTLYKYNQKEINQTIIGTYKILKYYYINLKNFIYLPYNSFVLLDKLELANEPKEKTLVLNLDKTLVCYRYSLFDGFKIIQRPGLKHFINELSDYYEIVIFSNEDRSLIEYISNLIDKNNNKIRYKLGNECIKYVNGIPIKDLNYLNRDIDSTIIIDFDLNNISNSHKNNTIVIPKFNGDGTDRELFFIIPFMKIISNKMSNIQNYIKKYGNYKTYENYYKQNQNNKNQNSFIMP